MTENKTATYVKLPVVIKPPYDWLYNNKPVYDFCDNQMFVDFITLGACRTLSNAVVREIAPRSRVLQMGATFGSQIEDTAYKIGNYGTYKVIDTNSRQIKRCENKYMYLFPQLSFEKADATRYKSDEKYDAVICYNLLHELPPISKTRAVNNALNLIKTRGKVIFIEYNDPGKWNPLRYFLKMFNRLYQPFAEKIWERDIATYAENRSRFFWRKTLYYKGMYQKVVAIKKALPE